jgi:hypothetical protein
MGHAFYLQEQESSQPEVIGFLTDLLLRVYRGEVTGLVCAMAVRDRKDEVALVGDYAEDRAYAMRAVEAAHGLLAHDAFDA